MRGRCETGNVQGDTRLSATHADNSNTRAHARADRTAEHNKSYETLRPMLSRTLLTGWRRGRRVPLRAITRWRMRRLATPLPLATKKGSHLNYEFVAGKKSECHKNRAIKRAPRCCCCCRFCAFHIGITSKHCISGR